MSLPASQAAGRLLFLQLLDTMPIRAEALCVNLPAGAATGSTAPHQLPARRLEYQLGSSLLPLPLPALETSPRPRTDTPLTTAMRSYAAGSQTPLQRRYS
jgi:hypothetical protein